MDQVMSVTGPVAASTLGMTLTHEHIFINLMREYRGDGLLHDVQLMCDEVQRFGRAGGGTIIDCTTEELGRNPEGLKRISEATGVKSSWVQATIEIHTWIALGSIAQAHPQ